MTTQNTTPATVETVANNQEKPAIKSNKDFRMYMTTSAIDFAAIREEASQKALIANPELKIEEASRRAALGTVGMKADTHMRCNGLLSGLTDSDMRVLKLFGFDLARLPKPKDQGGFTREEKFYILTACVCISQNKRPDSIDLTGLNDALKKIDPEASRKTVGHASINYLINLLQDVTSWTCNGFKEEAGHKDLTQAGNISNWLNSLGLAKQDRSAGSKPFWKTTPDQEHPIIKALIAIK